MTPSRPEPRTRRISTGRRALFLGAMGLALLSVLEIALRALKVAPDLFPLEVTTANAQFMASSNPRLGWVPKPGVAGVNADGYRDRRHAVDKPPGTYRIVVLGDSVAFGACVPNRGQTFSNVLERQLHRAWAGRFENVEVVNLGVPGYDTAQEVELLRQRGLPFSPDLVMVAVCLNDFDSIGGAGAMSHLIAGDTEQRHAVRAATLRVVQVSHLARVVWSGVDRARRARAVEREQSDEPSGADPVSQGFAELAGLAGQHGFQVMVTVFPVFRRNVDQSTLNLHRTVTMRAEAHGWRVFDLLETFRPASRNPREVSCDGLHPNTLGHRLAGEAIAKHLMEHPPAG